MKIGILLLLSLFSFSCCFAQRGSYKIKIVEHKAKTRGIFYKAEDNGLTLIKNNGDTLKIAAGEIKALYIHRRGIVAPFAIGAAIASAAVVANLRGDALEKFVAIFAGIPLGTSAGLLAGDLIANKRYCEKLEPRDFPLIKSDLQRYTVVK